MLHLQSLSGNTGCHFWVMPHGSPTNSIGLCGIQNISPKCLEVMYTNQKLLPVASKWGSGAHGDKWCRLRVLHEMWGHPERLYGQSIEHWIATHHTFQLQLTRLDCHLSLFHTLLFSLLLQYSSSGSTGVAVEDAKEANTGNSSASINPPPLGNHVYASWMNWSCPLPLCLFTVC